ncbi:MAG: IS110 family transposase, partial [Pseudomonadota bacterium]
MNLFAGLDISLDFTHICIVDEDGRIIRETKVPTEPSDIARSLYTFRTVLKRVGFEASSLSPWLSSELRKDGLPATVVEARHMASALSAMRNKTDRNDAKGIAQMMRTGWFREVHVKSEESHKLRILLANRRMLKRKFLDIENTIRGTLKVFGIKIGHVSRSKFDHKMRELLRNEDPFLQEMIDPMLQARGVLFVQFTRCERLIMLAAKANPITRRFMTIPGVGPMTAVAVMSGIDDPRRFRHSKTVGAYFGMTPQRFQSGTVDREGCIS